MAAVVGLLWLQSVVAPTATAFAASRERTRVEAQLETLDFIGKHGEVTQHFRGPRLIERQASIASMYGRVDSTQIAKLRAPFVGWANVSKKGAASVSMLLTIVDALEAPTAAEFHARIQSLPIQVQRHHVKTEDGVSGIEMQYLVRGQLRIRTFRADGMRSPGTSDANAPSARKVGGPSVDDCTYTDPDNNYFEGDCATQQDIDDGLAILAATDSDVSSVDDEVNSTADSYCMFNRSDCDWRNAYDELDLTRDKRAGDAGAALLATVGGPSAESPLGAITAFHAGGAEIQGCGAAGWTFAGSAILTMAASYNLGVVTAAVNPPAGAVFFAGLALLGCAAVAVGAGIALYDCMK